MSSTFSANRVTFSPLASLHSVWRKHPEREKYIRPLPNAHWQILAAMVVRRRQLTIMLTAERNRLFFF